MTRVGRDAPLPTQMQGQWVDADDSASELIVSGGEVEFRGRAVEYDYKLIEEVDGALTVSLMINDATAEDTFQRSNVTGLVITPEGEFHAYNVKFACHLIRANS